MSTQEILNGDVECGVGGGGVRPEQGRHFRGEFGACRQERSAEAVALGLGQLPVVACDGDGTQRQRVIRVQQGRGDPIEVRVVGAEGQGVTVAADAGEGSGARPRLCVVGGGR